MDQEELIPEHEEPIVDDDLELDELALGAKKKKDLLDEETDSLDDLAEEEDEDEFDVFEDQEEDER